MTIIAMIPPAMATDAFGVAQPSHGDLRLGPELAKRMAGARRFDDNAMRAGTKAAGSPGGPQEAIMSCGRKHSQGGLGLGSHGWFGARLFVILAATVVAAYVTARLL